MSDHTTDTRPIVPMKWEGPISDTDTARKYLIRYMAANFEDRTFMPYIRDELAGDFAYNLARALAQTAPEGWKDTLEKIDIKAQAGLCQMTFGGAREFLKDVRNIVKEAAAPSAPIQANSEDAKDQEIAQLNIDIANAKHDASSRYEGMMNWKRAAEAKDIEIAKLMREVKSAKADADMYANAWQRELCAYDGKIINKRHHIDAMVLTTQDLVKRLKAAEAQIAATAQQKEDE